MIYAIDTPKVVAFFTNVALALMVAIFFCWLFMAATEQASNEHQREYQRNGVVTTEANQ